MCKQAQPHSRPKRAPTECQQWCLAELWKAETENGWKVYGREEKLHVDALTRLQLFVHV